MNLQTSAICISILVVVCIQGRVCESCDDGWYHDFCNLQCPANCISCSNATACGPCHVGIYGLSCNKLCSSGCNTRSCEKWTGKCASGCQDGYVGEYCCKPGKSGEGCTVTGCSEHCTHCLSNGTCISCDDGYYGTTCSNTCLGTCANLACNKDTGLCDTCADGVYGRTCDMICPDQCSLNICLINGTCPSCIAPYYGDACESICFRKCDNRGCDKHTGNCKSCLVGFSGIMCSVNCSPNCKTCLQSNPHQCTECADGKYGVDGDVLKCNVDCNSNCKGNICSAYNGNCLNGCADGYEFHGYVCEDANEPPSSGPMSPRALIFGASGGGIAFIAIVIIAVVCYIRNRTGRSEEAAAVDTYDSIAGVTFGQAGQSQDSASDGTSSREGNNYDALNLDRTEGSSAYTALAITSTSTAGNYVNLQRENNQDDSGIAPPTNTDYQNLNV